ncbi:MAG TPA: TonB-dependent receptor [Sphingobium sp.]|uniref:TonB-dependent receptor n=1 Tax=Sphingobium sp. TaxID=1912891 RepID=UPI002ED4F0CE
MIRPIIRSPFLSAGLCVLPLLAPHSAIAEEGEASPPIVVLAGTLDLPPGMPAYGQSVIDKDRLDSAASGRVEDVLRDVAGFSQFRRSDSRSANPSAQGANLRSLGGNAASRTLVLLDGVPMADPFFGYIPYSAIVPDRLSGIRVTRGGGAGAFGAGAVAGTIEMASATRADLPLLSASALYGSRDAQEVSATVSPDVGAGFLSVSGRYERGDGFQTTPASQWTPATVPARYESWSAGLRAVAPINDMTELQARLLVYRDDRTLRFAGADSHAEGQDASIRLLSRGDWQVDALAYVQARNFSNVVISSSTFRKTLDQRNTPALGLGGKIELRPPVGTDHLLRFGVDSRYAHGDMLEDAYNANIAANPVTARRHGYGQQLTVGGFVEDDWTLGRLVLTAGGRVDRWTISDASLKSLTVATGILSDTRYPDRSGWEAGGRVGALWQASPIIALRAAAYTGFRLPTLNELYRSFTVFPVTTNANPDLKPEHLRGAEVGIDLTPAKGIAIGLTLFDNRLDDAIANVTTGVNIRTRQNVNAIEAQGIELTASAHVGAMRLTSAYAYSYSKVRAPGKGLDGLDPAQSPRNAASATLAWEPKSGARLAATLRYTGRQYEDDLNVDSLPKALTLDGFARLPLRHGVALIGRVENLFNETVYTRWVSTPTLSQDLGTPQTFWIGVQVGLGR